MYSSVQRVPRTKMVLPLRVWLEDLGAETPTYLAHTIDTSEIGCRVGGLRTEVHPGQIITLQRGQKRAPFRVIWSRQLDPRESQAGLEAVDPSVNIWLANSPAAPVEIERTNRSAPAAPAITVAPAAPHVAHATIASEEPAEKSIVTRARRRLSWCLGVSLMLVSMAGGLYLGFRVFPDSVHAAITPQVPAPPTAEELARLTPKPHAMPASLATPLQPSDARVEVVEAPTGHVVYPIPDDFITGKVRLQIVIAANGLVKQIHVLSGKQALAEAAAKAVRLWHYPSLAGTDIDKERETSVTISFLGIDAVSLEFPHARSSRIAYSKDN